jgi:hypothetical protein
MTAFQMGKGIRRSSGVGKTDILLFLSSYSPQMTFSVVLGF